MNDRHFHKEHIFHIFIISIIYRLDLVKKNNFCKKYSKLKKNQPQNFFVGRENKRFPRDNFSRKFSESPFPPFSTLPLLPPPRSLSKKVWYPKMLGILWNICNLILTLSRKNNWDQLNFFSHCFPANLFCVQIIKTLFLPSNYKDRLFTVKL